MFVLCISFSTVCNFIVHERCLKTVTLPCYSVAATLVKNPVAHVWSERLLIKGRKFCNVCRKKMEDVVGICCEGGYTYSISCTRMSTRKPRPISGNSIYRYHF